LEADTVEVGLEAIVLEVTTTVAQLADPDEGVGLDAMSFTHAPGALVAQPLIGPVPWAVNGFLYPSDVAGVEG
jgi:hypothetical protein